MLIFFRLVITSFNLGFILFSASRIFKIDFIRLSKLLVLLIRLSIISGALSLPLFIASITTLV